MFHKHSTPTAQSHRSAPLKTAVKIAVPVLLTTSLGAVGPATMTAAPAQATPQRLCGVNEVPEFANQVLIKTLAPWESLTVSPGGSIWAGVWLTGTNGPAGWASPAPFYYPLPSANRYSLIGRIDGKGWNYIGSTARNFYNDSPVARNLYARVNDDVPGNGSGSFNLTYCFITG